MALVKIKNNSGAEGTWMGQTIADGEYYEIPANERNDWVDSNDVFEDVAGGNLVINDGVSDVTEPVSGWKLLEGTQTMPLSRHLEGKLAVHSSSKPEPNDIETYAVWAGAGDDIEQADASDSIGTGELLMFNMTYGNLEESKNVKFDPRHGRVWIHEAYIKFENGGIPDYLSADIMAPATPVQQVANLDLILDGDWVKYSPSGPGTGTHGFGGTPALVPRSYSKDGDWDFDGTNLTPNFTSTGGYKIATVERSVHRYFNKIPLHGSSTTFCTMSSEETAELLVALGYYIRITVHNVSNSNWSLSAIMEIFRERTVDP